MNRLSTRLVNTTNLIEVFEKIAKTKGYSIFNFNGKHYNLNIWGIRSLDKETRTYNDSMVIFWQDIEGLWHKKIYDITTDPSEQNLLKPINRKGTAILIEGQHRNLWTLGKHKGKYEALVQSHPCTVARDNNKDKVLDIDKSTYEYGVFGINCHRASSWKIVDTIGLYSAGCQVHKDVNRFNNEFMDEVRKSVKQGFKYFSYTLINETDLAGY